jgi:C-terminal processing protease CtpA/Prc
MASTNRLKGLVLDLRYANGQDYKAAAILADQFFSKQEPLIDWGDGLQKGTSKTNAVELPMAILVNRGTSGAAEAVAGILRQAQLGLILGTNTAGNAAIAREFALSTGQRVRVASTPIKLADGKPFPSSGLKPDIYVDVNPEDELVWFDDSFKVLNKPITRITNGATNELSSSSTNRGPRRRLNEAELVRMLKEGLNPETELGSAAKEVERNKGLVSDPVLARALDLLKGLTVVQQFRSS